MIAGKGLLTVLALLSAVAAQVNDDEESAKRLRQLYKVLHNIALPAPLHGGKSSKRLVMMLPGQVLSEADYHPGPEFLVNQGQTDADRYLEYPPIKMQNLFNLVDVVPGIDPLQGQASQESFSRIYKDILGKMDIKGVDTLAKDSKVRQEQSIKYLLEVPKKSQDPDGCNNVPDDVCIKTRWDIYRYYEKIYNTKKMAMEEKIEFERNNRTSLEYQYWFIRAYPSLQAEVDGAFMDWLVKGEKDVIELYRSRLGTSSVGTQLLEAKNAFRASGFQSLDRTKTVYPINMIPGNWYESLRDPDLKLTPDQRNMQIAYLNARLSILQAMKSGSCDTTKEETSRKETKKEKFAAVVGSATTIMTKRCECAQDSTSDACAMYLTEIGEIAEKADVAAYSEMAVAGLDQLTGNKQAIDEEIATVEGSIEAIRNDDGGTAFALPGLASLALGPQPAPPNNWQQFDYDSSTQEKKETSEKTSTSFSLSFKARFGLFSIGGSVSHSKQTQDNFSSFKSTNVKITGELLRVTVQMPWFRPELFLEEKLKLSDNARVSPGRFDTDKEYSDEVLGEGNGDNPYRLPQYVTGILLCRNLSLEFGGVSRQSTYSFVATSLSTSLSVGYGPFSLSASYSRSSQKASFQASATATGLRIGVPGVQMIGYYTEVPPKFPK